MKTKILAMAAAVFAITIAAPVANARPDFPVKPQPTSHQASKASHRMPDHCSMTCCVTKWVPTAGPGRASSNSFRKIRTCTNDCSVTARDRKEVCRKGGSA